MHLSIFPQLSVPRVCQVVNRSKNTACLLSLCLIATCFGGCKKAESRESVQSSTHDAMADLKKLPNADKHLEIFVNGNADPFPQDVFEMDPSKLEVEKAGNDRFDLRMEHSGLAKSAIYSTLPAEFVEVEGRTKSVTVVELLVPKGARKTRKSHVSVIHGPMGWGKDPTRIDWNWRSVEEAGDDMSKFDARGPRIGWATAEQLKINSEGTASALTEVLIKGTPDFEKAATANPKLKSL